MLGRAGPWLPWCTQLWRCSLHHPSDTTSEPQRQLAMSAPAPPALATRSATACIRCRRMKTKCLHDDNGQPCRGCLKAQQQCVFPGKIPRAPKVPVIAGLPLPPATPQHQHQEVRLPDPSDPTHALELHPSHIQDCERALVLWPFPCFHRPGFIRRVKAGQLPQTLNYAVLSSGARASPGLIQHFGSPGGASEFFAEKAQANIVASLDCPSIPDVQSLCLLAMHHWGSGRGTRAYILLGMASRMAQMFLPQATCREEDFIAAETARRAIWTCFIMDQFLSCGSGRPPAIRDEYVQIQLPCSEDDFHFGSSVCTPAMNGELPGYAPPDSPRADVGEFGHMIRVSALWRRAISWVMDPPEDEQDDRQYHQLMSDLTNWTKTLPSRQQDTPGKIDLHIQVGNGYSFAFTHCVYYCALVFLSRKQLHRMGRRTGGADTDADVTHTIDTITHASQRITALVTTLDATNIVDAPPAYPIVVLFAAFTAASTVANMTLQGVIDQLDLVSSVVYGNLEVLRKSAPVWPLAERWYWDLSRLYSKLQVRNPSLSLHSENGSTPPVNHHDQPRPPTSNGNGESHTYNGAQRPSSSAAPEAQQPNGTRSRLPSPFLAASDAPQNEAKRENSAEDSSERDHAAFDEHLKGLGDLATFLGTNGFRY